MNQDLNASATGVPSNPAPSHPAPVTQDDRQAPLPDELGIPDVATPQRAAVSKKGLLAVGLMAGSVIAVAVVSLQRLSTSITKHSDSDAPLTRDKPAVASSEPRRLELPAAAGTPGASGAWGLTSPAVGAAAHEPRIPALIPSADETAEPIGVRRTGSTAPATGTSKVPAAQDASVLLVSTRPAALGGAPADTAGHAEPAGDPSDAMRATSRHLEAYQRQLQGLLDKLNTGAAFNGSLGSAPGSALPPPPGNGGGTGAGGLFGGQLQGSATPRAVAAMLGNRSLTLPKGTSFTCALKTRLISAASGLVGCQVQRNVFGDDGRVLLIERGSHLDGEYRIASVRPGAVRIPVLWTRLRTPLGVTVDLDSPATGPLGESGIEGHVDNRWGERIGAAMLLSLIDDAVKLVIQNQAADAGVTRQGDTLVLPATTANTSKLAEKVLDSTINIPPLIYQNQGGVVGIYVARDVDFSSVYELRPTPAESSREWVR